MYTFTSFEDFMGDSVEEILTLKEAHGFDPKAFKDDYIAGFSHDTVGEVYVGGQIVLVEVKDNAPLYAEFCTALWGDQWSFTAPTNFYLVGHGLV